ncbi:MYCBP-associated protein [Myxocyprinus asiaticus]|uniref:MYCBP-associated protein n=1 Tax=Myxocyprinus asiaticus TaxID=70543 RepID=UPI0022236ECD|nr:MYCBP-associated protein [Myxocyprinus asiaticus]
MAGVGKSSSKIHKRETRPPTPSDKKTMRGSEEISSSSCGGEEDHSPILNGDDIQSLTIRAEDLESLRVPKPPTDSQKPKSMTRVYVRKKRPPDEVGRMVRVTVARPLPQETAPLHLDYAGPGGPRFDSQGMLLPHSILGNLEDFRTEMELRGETELVKRIPEQKKLPLLVVESERYKDKDPSETVWNQQYHALQHWYRHMTERRRQQDFISRLLQKPVDTLLMNHSNTFRQMQEQRDLISRGLPALHAGHGQRVGSEFWSLPQWFGDELSGITATLTQTERGNPPPITRIGQPYTTRLESGNVLSDAVNSGWDQSVYLQQCRHKLKDIQRDIDVSAPEVDGLEVLGSGLRFTSTSVRPSPPPDKREEQDEEQKENEDPLAFSDDVIMVVEMVPCLRFCGELARWTGSVSSHQGQEGISARLAFETITGESVNADLELKNEGSTAIYYSWEKLNQTHTHTQHFYFDNTTAVILPGSTKRITFIFKSVRAGIMTEVWRLNTHPVLMGGASLQVKLRGVALDTDKTADQRAALERELQHKASVSLCRCLVSELVKGVCTPERPSSPDDLYVTDEERFRTHNPNLQYHRELVEALQELWQQVKGSGRADGTHTPVWDLSLNTLRQIVLSVPETDGLSRETHLSQYNSLIMQLQTPHIHTTPVTPHNISVQFWRELLDSLVSESVRLRNTLGLPENNTWSDTTQDHNIEEKMEKEEAEEKRGETRLAAKDKPVEECESVKKNVERKTDAQERESSFTLQHKYRRLLRTQVYVLMERMVDTLCDILDEQTQQDPQTTI